MGKVISDIVKSTVFFINERMVQVEVKEKDSQEFQLIWISDHEHTIGVNMAEMRALIEVLKEIDEILPEPNEFK